MNHLEEDWESVSILDKMWLIEKEKQMFVDWQQFDEEQEKLPAIIKVLTPIHNEINTIPFPF